MVDLPKDTEFRHKILNLGIWILGKSKFGNALQNNWPTPFEKCQDHETQRLRTVQDLEETGGDVTTRGKKDPRKKNISKTVGDI